MNANATAMIMPSTGSRNAPTTAASPHSVTSLDDVGGDLPSNVLLMTPPRKGEAVPEDITLPATVTGDDGLIRPVWAAVDPLLRHYYDNEWGMPIRDEQGLFERISLEAFQSGLSWAIILRKRPNFRVAFADFHPDTVAAYTDDDVQRLLGDTGIVRNRLKILATINNAKATIRLRETQGLVDFVWSFKPERTPEPRTYADVPTKSPESLALAKALRKKGFSFVGPTTMYALMEAVGILDTHLLDSHRRGTSGVWSSR